MSRNHVRKLSYSFITLCQSFIEDNLKIALARMEVKIGNIDNKTIEGFLDRFALECNQKSLLKKHRNLKNDLEGLRRIRNSIIHCGGRVRLDDEFEYDGLVQGIYTYLGMLEVTKTGCEAALDIVKRLVDILLEMEKRKIQK